MQVAHQQVAGGQRQAVRRGEAVGEGAAALGAAVAVLVAQQGDPISARLGEEDVAVGRHQQIARVLQPVGEDVGTEPLGQTQRHGLGLRHFARPVADAGRRIGLRQLLGADLEAGARCDIRGARRGAGGKGEESARHDAGKAASRGSAMQGWPHASMIGAVGGLDKPRQRATASSVRAPRKRYIERVIPQ